MYYKHKKISSAAELAALVDEVGFLPLLNMGRTGLSVEEIADEESQYVKLPEGGWEWPLWMWKGNAVRISGCAYGRFFNRQAGFVSRRLWPDFCNYRRALHPRAEADSLDEMVLTTLAANGSMVTRDLRRASGFTEPKMRSRFDTVVTRLQMACRVVTEDFVYPMDRHGQMYGWGFSLLTTPERLFGRETCCPDRTPQQSLDRMMEHYRRLLPGFSEEYFKLMLE